MVVVFRLLKKSVIYGLLFIFLQTQFMGPLLAQRYIIPVPPGNRNTIQPPINRFAFSRTESTQETFEQKYRQSVAFFKKNASLIVKIKKISKIYGVDPIHVIGAIIGEHTYNVNVSDFLQTYYYKAIEYAGMSIQFRYGDLNIKDFVTWPQFSPCMRYKNSYDLWSCRELIWDEKFRGKTVNGMEFKDGVFAQIFFQPFFAGQTFGLGQLSPLAALRLSDTVQRYSRFEGVTMNDAPGLYQSIMHPEKTLHYIAALVRVSIDAYRDIAGFDISDNPGVLATLFNLGNVRQRAYTLKEKNDLRRMEDKNTLYPQENYYGWLINERLEDLKKLL